MAFLSLAKARIEKGTMERIATTPSYADITLEIFPSVLANDIIKEIDGTISVFLESLLVDARSILQKRLHRPKCST